MNKFFSKRSGSVSMVEIVVTSIIFITAAVGLVVTTTSFRPAATDASGELRAIYQAKEFLEELRTSVDASTYDNCPAGGVTFNPAIHNPLCPTAVGEIRNQVFGAYTISYTIGNISDAREVNLTVSWDG